jgi:transposase-like protein
MEKKDQERRTYSKKFKAEAAALAEKKEKPISQIAMDLGINESMLRRWMQQTREAAQGGLPPFPATGGRGTGNWPGYGSGWPNWRR